MPKTVESTARRSESMQQSSATPKDQDLGIWLWKIVTCSHSVHSCIYSFWRGVIPTSYTSFVILVSLFFYPGLALTVARGEMILPVRSLVRATRIDVRACVLCARIKTEVVTLRAIIKIKWHRSKRNLLFEGETLLHYKIIKGTSRTKIRPSHVKIVVFRPLIWTVDRLYWEKIAVWPISVYIASDGF